MTSISWAILLGWPAIGLAALLFGIATYRKSIALALAGCVAAFPMFLYLGLTPAYGIFSAVAYILLLTGAVRIRNHSRSLTGVLAAPAVAMLIWLASQIAQQ